MLRPTFAVSESEHQGDLDLPSTYDPLSRQGESTTSDPYPFDASKEKPEVFRTEFELEYDGPMADEVHAFVMRTSVDLQKVVEKLSEEVLAVGGGKAGAGERKRAKRAKQREQMLALGESTVAKVQEELAAFLDNLKDDVGDAEVFDDVKDFLSNWVAVWQNKIVAQESQPRKLKRTKNGVEEIVEVEGWARSEGIARTEKELKAYCKGRNTEEKERREMINAVAQADTVGMLEAEEDGGMNAD